MAATDPEARQMATGALNDLFSHLGGQGGGQAGSGVDVGGLIGQFTEFANMPMELATLFINYAVQLTDLTLKTIEEAGVVFVKGVTPL